MNSWHLELPHHKILADEEVRKLLYQAQIGDQQAREKLIECNLRLVASIIRRFEYRGIEIDDLFQIGCIGLVKAIDDFDLSYDVKFSTYAVPKIIGEVKRYIRESGPLRVSRSLKQLASRGIAVKDHLTAKLGRTPLISEIAGELGVTSEELTAALDAVSPVVSLQEIIYEDDGNPISLADQMQITIEDSSLYLKDILNSLDEEERRLLLLRYFAEKSQTEVAAEFGISQAQVSRIETRILHELRNQLETKG
ncbi:MAG: SigB/SigF/SigG family RNA polymerase sigma factor [Firmicutes bacterium]|nr:SigB/SigF/SigG family RNA polymerase sigma factor [Bacillota bacterium]